MLQAVVENHSDRTCEYCRLRDPARWTRSDGSPSREGHLPDDAKNEHSEESPQGCLSQKASLASRVKTPRGRLSSGAYLRPARSRIRNPAHIPERVHERYEQRTFPSILLARVRRVW